MRLQERRSQTFSNVRQTAPQRPPNKRRISDSVATRTRARIVAQQAYSSTVSQAQEEETVEQSPPVRGERKPVITASALTMYFHLIDITNLD